VQFAHANYAEITKIRSLIRKPAGKLDQVFPVGIQVEVQGQQAGGQNFKD
jgi:hypothetical protein